MFSTTPSEPAMAGRAVATMVWSMAPMTMEGATAGKVPKNAARSSAGVIPCDGPGAAAPETAVSRGAMHPE
jgi:hypothetical protein